MPGGKAAISVDHSSAFLAAVVIDNNDDDVTFVSSFQGRKTDLPSEIEKDIANFNKSMAALGFGSTMLEFQDLVKDFEEMKSIKTRFTDNRPGYD